LASSPALLKNKVDDLMNSPSVSPGGRRKQAPELRQSYDLLMMKVLSLLQDSDPSLVETS